MMMKKMFFKSLTLSVLMSHVVLDTYAQEWNGAGTGTVYLNNSSDNVGIGYNTVPSVWKLLVGGPTVVINPLGAGYTHFNGSSGNDQFFNTTFGTNVVYLQAGYTGTATSPDLGFITSGTEHMRILANGKIGVGTTTPAYKLDVNGDINLSLGQMFRIGGDQVFNVNGVQNTLLGKNAGLNNSSGSHNTFLGNVAGYSNTTGYNNIYVGDSSGFNNANDSNNCFLGTRAGMNNSGSRNLFLGTETGLNNQGDDNIFMGTRVGLRNSTGYQNIAIGSTILGPSTGFANVILGADIIGPTTGSDNILIGKYAGGILSSASSNIVIGGDAGGSLTTGVNNVFLGASAGFISISSGVNNTLLGFNTGTNSSLSGGGSGIPALGREAFANCVNCVIIGRSTNSNYDNVGLGTDNPAYQFHVSTNSAAKPGSNIWIIASDKELKKNIEPFNDGLDLLVKINPVWFEYNGKANTGGTKGERFVGIIAQEMQKIIPYTVGSFEYRDSSGNVEKYLDYDGNAITYIIINSIKEQQRQIENKEKEIENLKQEIKTVMSEVISTKDQNNQLVSTINELKARLDALEQKPGGENATLAPAVSKIQKATLEQNEPNPFSENTVIKYFVPQKAGKASIIIRSDKAQEVMSFTLEHKGNGNIIVSGSSLSIGTYNCELYVDGKLSDSKKMILVK